MPRLSVSASTVIFLVRHGETEYNRQNRFNGRSNSPLTDVGIGEARRHGQVLREYDLDALDMRVVSSPLGRAIHTAELIGEEIGVSPSIIEVDPRLTEISFGVWEGLTIDEIRSRYPGEWENRHRNMWTYTMPEGESYAMVARRVGAWLEDARGRLLVVTHGAVDRVLRGLYAGLPADEICALDEPQNVLFKLEGGTITRL
jgi:broad specificity phosphatase PhoE